MITRANAVRFVLQTLSSQSEGARKHYSLVWCPLLLSRYLSQVPVECYSKRKCIKTATPLLNGDACPERACGRLTHNSWRAQMLPPPFYLPSKACMFKVIRFHPSHRLFSRLLNHYTANLTIPLGN